jgi:hypothetical protein
MNRALSMTAAVAILAVTACGDPTDPAKDVASVQITATSTNPRVGQTTTLGATPVNSGGVAVQGVTCTMTSSNPGVLAVAAGSAGWTGTGVSAGSAVVTAACGAVSNTLAITVRPPEVTLTINKGGTGTGSVFVNPSGTTFDAGTSVTLTATPAAGSTFTAWGGACSGNSSTCLLTLNTNQTVTATFDLAPETFTGSIPSTQMGSATEATCLFTEFQSGTLSAKITSTNGTVTGTSSGTSLITVTASGSPCTGSSSSAEMAGTVTGTATSMTISATSTGGTRNFTFVGARSGNTLTGTLTIRCNLITTNGTTGVQTTYPFEKTIANYTLTKQ